MKTQGTELYAIDPANNSILVVGCVTSISGLDSSIDQIETTCLSDTERTYEAGLGTPGTGTFGINTDPQDASHRRLFALKKAGETLQWAIGWSDGTGIPPTVDSDGDFDLPDTRSWLLFNGFMNSFPFDFSSNAVVATTVGIQISGGQELIPKVIVS